MAANLWEALQPQIQQGLMEQFMQAQQPTSPWDAAADAFSAFAAGIGKAPRGMGIGYGAAAAAEALKPYAEQKKRGTKLSVAELAKMAEIAETFRPKKGNLPEVLQLQEILSDPTAAPEAKAAAEARIRKLSYIDQPDKAVTVPQNELPPGTIYAQREVESGKLINVIKAPGKGTPATTWTDIPKDELPPGMVYGRISSSGKKEFIKGAGETGGTTGFARGEKPQRLQWLADKSYQIQNEGWESLTPKDRYNYTVLYGQEVEPVETIREGVSTVVRPPLPAGIVPPPGTPWAEEMSRPAEVPPASGTTPAPPAGPSPAGSQYIPPQPESGQVKIDYTAKEKTDITNLNTMEKALDSLETLARETKFTEKMNPFGTESAGLMTAYKNAQNQVRALANTGVLNVGEIPFIQDILNDPTSWTAAFNPERIAASVAELKKYSQLKKDAYAATIKTRKESPGSQEAVSGAPGSASTPNYDAMSVEDYLKGP